LDVRIRTTAEGYAMIFAQRVFLVAGLLGVLMLVPL
jgi:hypothetical protein